jgi:nucleoid DNA-binding protein
MITMTQPKRSRTLPVRECPVCGGEYFREVEVQVELGTEPAMPMWILVCLCGARQTPHIGGVRGGGTPNRLLSRFFDSLEPAQRRHEALAERSGIEQAAQESLAERADLKEYAKEIRRLEKLLSRFRSPQSADGKIKGGMWRLPQREPASTGRDRLAAEAQKCGASFDQARKAVNVVFAAMKRALASGEDVVISQLGRFTLRRRTKEHYRVSQGKVQRMHRQPNRVVFEPDPDLIPGMKKEKNKCKRRQKT